MSFTPRRVELPFSYQGFAFTAVFSWATIAQFEEESGLSILDFAGGLASSGKSPRLCDMGRLLLAALTEKHPDLTIDHAMELITLPEVQAIFSQGIAAAMPNPSDSREAGEAPPANPPLAARANRSAGRKP